MTNHGSIDVDVTIDGEIDGTVQEGSGGGTKNYERLTNKPQINDVELIGNKSLEDLGIKNNVQPDWEQSDSEAEDYVKNKPENLVSDANYIHTDNNFTDADKSAIDNIPTDLADLNDDSSHRTVSDTEKTTWNGKSSVSANPSSTTQTLTGIEIDGVGYSIEGGGGGAVSSVNGQTGAVVLDAEDVGALPSDTLLFSGAYADLTGKPTLGTASALNVATSGDASTSEVVKGDDTRLTDSRNAKDVYSWAKESTKPSYTYSEIQNKPTLGTASAKDYVNSVVDGSSDLVTSDAVHDYVDSAISGVYKPSGNKTCAELLPALLIASNLGNVYNMTDSGTTTADFVEGAGKTIEIGDNVVIVDVGTQNNATYKFDLLSGMVDLSNYIQKSATSGLIKNDGSIDTNAYATTSQIPDITGKADKVTSAVDGNFAGLDSNGNLTDSGHKHSDYLTQHQDISGKADKVTGATNGNLAKLDANGNLADGGWSSDKTTTSATGNPISISGLKSNQLAVNPIITLEPIQSGSGTPSSSNVRAISGYDKVKVLSCGKNLFDKSEVVLGGLDTTTGEETSSTTTYRSGWIRVKASTTYVLSGFANVIRPYYYGQGGAFIERDSSTTASTFTTPSGCAYVRFQIASATWTGTSNPQLEETQTATTYVPYDKATSISKSLGQTKYWLEYDVRSGKAKIKGTDKIDLGSLSWTMYGSGSSAYFDATHGLSNIKNLGDGYCECYKISQASSVSGMQNGEIRFGGTKFFIKDTAQTSASDLTTALNGKYAVAELDVYGEIQLTPHEISLLKDYAYVSTNGTSISLDYHNGELASLADVSQLGETVNELGKYRTMHNYSTTEQVVGTWIDGKPVYEKTIIKNSYQLSSGTNNIDLNISNMKMVIDSSIHVTNSAKTNVRKLSHYEKTGDDQLGYYITLNNGMLTINAYNTWSTPDIYITIRYTKTID